MKYSRIQTIDPIIAHAVSVLSARLLSGERVLWLLSGGSAIELEVRIAQALQTLDISRLSIGLIDERYGPPGHQDENYLQLMDAHFPFFINRVLTGAPPKETAAHFGQWAKKELGNADYSLGIFGIGTDGHTAGIKAESPSVNSKEPAIHYDWEDHRRITLTQVAFRHLDEAIIYAAGAEKREMLTTLLRENLPVNEQPAQLLKTIPTSTLYTDNNLDGAQ